MNINRSGLLIIGWVCILMGVNTLNTIPFGTAWSTVTGAVLVIFGFGPTFSEVCRIFVEGPRKYYQEWKTEQ